METLVSIIITPFVLLAAAKVMPRVHVKNTSAAIWTSLLILIVGVLIGWFITLVLNILTLGMFWIVGLGVITRTIAYAIVIEIVDWLRKDFNTDGFFPSLGLSIILAIAWGIVEVIFRA